MITLTMTQKQLKIRQQKKILKKDYLRVLFVRKGDFLAKNDYNDRILITLTEY